MRASDIYASRFLRGTDISRPVRAEIDSLSVETFTDPKTREESRKVVLSFVGKAKRLILNRTQAGTLSAAYGDELSAWPGKHVILSPGQAPNGQPSIVVAALPAETAQDGADTPFA